MVPPTESISNRYPELTMISGGGVLASRETRTLVFCFASAGVESPARIAAPLRGMHEVAAVEATPERNRRRDNLLESGMVDLPFCKPLILIVSAPGLSRLKRRRFLSGVASTAATSCIPLSGAAILAGDSTPALAKQNTSVRVSRRGQHPPAADHRQFGIPIADRFGRGNHRVVSSPLMASTANC